MSTEIKNQPIANSQVSNKKSDRFNKRINKALDLFPGLNRAIIANDRDEVHQVCKSIILKLDQIRLLNEDLQVGGCEVKPYAQDIIQPLLNLLFHLPSFGMADRYAAESLCLLQNLQLDFELFGLSKIGDDSWTLLQ